MGYCLWLACQNRRRLGDPLKAVQLRQVPNKEGAIFANRSGHRGVSFVLWVDSTDKHGLTS